MGVEIGRVGPYELVSSGLRQYRTVADIRSDWLLVTVLELREQYSQELWRGPVSARVDNAPVVARTAVPGFIALAADPGMAFPELETSSYQFVVQVKGPGFVPLEHPVDLAAGSVLPLATSTVDIARTPVTLRGRVVAAAGAEQPVENAQIDLNDPARLLLRTPLHHGHDPGVTVQRVHVAASAPVREVARRGLASSHELVLSSRDGIGPGSVLRLGQPNRFEFVVVEAIVPQPGPLTDPGPVTLSAALQRNHASGAIVQPVTVTDMAEGSTLDVRVRRGDSVLSLDVPGTFPAGTSRVRLDSVGASTFEVHELGGLTDQDGYFRIGGIAGPPRTEIGVQAAGFVDQIRAWAPDFGTADDYQDFRLEV